MLLCIYVSLSLVSFDKNDPSFAYSGGQPVQNFGGPVGAWLSDLLFQVFGYGSWSVLFIGGYLAMKLAGRPTGDPRRHIGWAAVFWVSLCFIALIWPFSAEQAYAAGGLIGEGSVEAMRSVVGPAGTWLIVFGCAIAVSPVLMDVNLEGMANRGLSGIEQAGPHLQGASNRAVSGISGVAGRASATLSSVMHSLTERFRRPALPSYADADELDYGDYEEVEHPSEPDSIPPSSAGMVEPTERSPSAFFDEPSELFAEDAEARTQVGQRELVEVEWETTNATPRASLGTSSLPVRAPIPVTTASGGLQGAVPAMRSNPAPVHAVLYDDAPVPFQHTYEERFDDLPPRRQRSSLETPPAPVPMASPAAEEAPSALPVVNELPIPAVPPALPAEDAPEPVPVPASAELPESAPPPVTPRRKVARKDFRLEVDDEALVSGGEGDDGLAVVQVDRYADFELPHLGLLDTHERSVAQFDEVALQALANTLEQKLADFGVKGEVTAIRPGPVITTFEYLPAPGIKLSKISGLSDDIAMALKALRVRIVAPIPGKGVVGIEIPNNQRQLIWIRDILANEAFRRSKGALPMVLGKTVDGRPQVTDLAKMPHLLVGGTTGSGKSVGVNAMLMSLLFTRTPEELRLILIDPKTIEFELYRDIPHLLHPVVTDPRLASAALKWACAEMDERYRLLARWKTRNIESFNRKVEKERQNWTPAKARRYYGSDLSADELPPPPQKMPFIVVVIDELADLMMIAAKDVEESIIRIAQKARAAGIHLIVATQRPSVNVITGLIKANMPSRIAFQIRTKVDSRTILDQNGAENLLGKGDMLFLPPGVAALERCHGAFVSDEEVRSVNDFLREQGEPEYEADLRTEDDDTGSVSEEEYDDLYDLAVAFVCREGKASTSMVQREFKIGYNRAARMIDIMEREGVVGPADGARPRKILVNTH